MTEEAIREQSSQKSLELYLVVGNPGTKYPVTLYSGIDKSTFSKIIQGLEENATKSKIKRFDTWLFTLESAMKFDEEDEDITLLFVDLDRYKRRRVENGLEFFRYDHKRTSIPSNAFPYLVAKAMNWR